MWELCSDSAGSFRVLSYRGRCCKSVWQVCDQQGCKGWGETCHQYECCGISDRAWNIEEIIGASFSWGDLTRIVSPLFPALFNFPHLPYQNQTLHLYHFFIPPSHDSALSAFGQSFCSHLFHFANMDTGQIYRVIRLKDRKGRRTKFLMICDG